MKNTKFINYQFYFNLNPKRFEPKIIPFKFIDFTLFEVTNFNFFSFDYFYSLYTSFSDELAKRYGSERLKLARKRE